ncbi:MAG: hypothetical protein M3547_00590 [Acidobacteriota bacterium]|nr:hypothetical protein [Acidobacteriota bacterium]
MVVAILLAVVASVVIALVALLGGGKRTVASRSAAAFEEAQRKGIPVGEAAHGGHRAALPGGGHAEMEMPGQGESGTPGHGGHAIAGSTTSGSSPHAGMQHGTAAPGSTATASPHAGMQHGTPAPRRGASQSTTEGAAGRAGHGGAEQTPADRPGSAPPEPLAKAAVARPGQPAATLEPDPLDAPAATSQIDAKRSAEIAAQMGSGGHGMQHGTGSYSQLDAGRESVQKTQPRMPDRGGMDHGSMPPSTPTPSPDTKKPRPPATAVPTPSGHVHPSGGGQR